MSIRTIGKSTLGKEIPLVVAARDPSISPGEAKRRGLPVVYVQANIHAGEVEGKEAVLMLLRELSRKPSDPLLDRIVLLVTPIYNIDGNDKLGPLSRNRPSQDGPDPVGERANGAGLDLNRDCMKAESPEMRAVLEHVYVRWDPDVIMDLHTTNGTRHGYQLTYSPPLNPAMDEEVLRYSRDLLAGIRARCKAKHGWELFDYGNVEGQGEARAWRTFGFEPRYVTNYAGVRNRIGVLSEAASFQPFEMRVRSTLAFVRDVLERVAKDASKVVRLSRAADERTARRATQKTPFELGVRFEMASRGSEPVLLEKPDPQNPVPRNKAPKNLELVAMEVFGQFRPTRTARFPAGYLFAPEHARAARLLARHGVTVEKVSTAWSGPAERFVVSECAVAPQAFQGHRLVRLEGKFETARVEFPAGSYWIRTGQPLGYLAFHMLEPESLDGAAAWGFFGTSFEAGSLYPVAKVPDAGATLKSGN